MKGYCYCVAAWLLLLGYQTSARKVAVAPELHSIGRSTHDAIAAIDLEAAKTDHHVKTATTHAAGKGHQGAQGGVAVKGSKTSQDHSEAHGHYAHKKGAEGKEKQATTYGQEGGKSHSSQGGGGHQSEHHEGEKGQSGFKYKGGDHHKKTGFTKAFHDKYHKDEYHKMDKYWKNAKENGGFHKYGEHGEHFHKEASKHSKGGKSSQSSEADQHGKKGKHAKGHQSSDHKGHQGHQGHQKQSAHSSHYAKKGGHSSSKKLTHKVRK